MSRVFQRHSLNVSPIGFITLSFTFIAAALRKVAILLSYPVFES